MISLLLLLLGCHVLEQREGRWATCRRIIAAAFISFFSPPVPFYKLVVRETSQPGPFVASVCLNCHPAFRATRWELLTPADKIPRCGGGGSSSSDLSSTFQKARRRRRNILILFYRARGGDSRCVGAPVSEISRTESLLISRDQSDLFRLFALHSHHQPKRERSSVCY